MDDHEAVPAGYTVRAPVPDDVETVFGIFADYNTQAVGFPDCTLDDVIDNFAEPGFVLATDAWLVHTDAGEPAGYACAFPDDGGAEAHIEVAATDPVLARWLRDRVIARVREIGRDAGHAEVTLDMGVHRPDERLRELLAEAGFAPETSYHRMRIDHDGPVAEPDLPAGVTRRTGTDDLEARRLAHEILEAAFAGQFGFTPRSLESWLDARDAKSTYDWADLTVLELDGVPVAMQECTSQFAEDEDCGYVATLAVLEAARGQGLAKLLLRIAFAHDSAAGLSGTILHVDTNNPTPALGVYTSVGMRPVLVIDAWRAVVPV